MPLYTILVIFSYGSTLLDKQHIVANRFQSWGSISTKTIHAIRWGHGSHSLSGKGTKDEVN